MGCKGVSGNARRCSAERGRRVSWRLHTTGAALPATRTARCHDGAARDVSATAKGASGTCGHALTSDSTRNKRQAAMGFEPMNNGFAIRRLCPLGYAAQNTAQQITPVTSGYSPTTLRSSGYTPCPPCTSTRTDLGRASSLFGSATSSTPLVHVARTSSASTATGNVMLRLNAPN